MSGGYYNNIKLQEGNFKTNGSALNDFIDASEMMTKNLSSFANAERNEFKEAEARRLRKLQEEREQFKFDREVNTDKALIDYQNQLARASAGGSMSDAQGIQLGYEFDRLSKTVGEEEAARIINEKAQKFGAQDAKRAESDPYYRAELIKGVALPSGNLDPKSLIDLRNSQIIRNETLGQRKDDLELRAKEREEDLWFKKQELAMRQAERNERALDKLNAKKAVAELNADSVIEDPNRSSSGAFYNVNQEKTGNKVVPKDAVIPEGEGSQELSDIDEITNRINSLSSKNLNKDGNAIDFSNDEQAFKVYIEENPDAANASAAGKAVSKGVDSAFDVIKNDMGMPTKMVISGLNLGFNKAKQAFMSDIERKEYDKKLDETKAKELQESLKSNSPGEKANAGNISFDEFKNLKKQQQDLDNAKIKELQTDLENKGLTYVKNLESKYGKDEFKSVPKEMTPHQAKIYETKRVTNLLVDKGVDPGIALEVGTKKGEDAYNFQANYIKNVNTDAKESAKNKLENVEKAKKKIEEEIKELRKLKNKIGTGREDKTWYGSKLLPIPEAQEEIDNDISALNRKIDNLK